MQVFQKVREDTIALWRHVIGDFLKPERLAPRAIDEIETVVSVLLSIALAHLLGARNIGWAAVTGYVVMRSTLSDSLLRGALRVTGTICGAVLAVLAMRYFRHDPLSLGAMLALVGGGSLYCALVRKHSYAWLFTGVTFSMVVLDALAEPDASLMSFATTRMTEVAAGTTACLLVNLLSHWSVRARFLARRAAASAAPSAVPVVMTAPAPAGAPAPVRPAEGRQATAHHALQVALALALLPMLSRWIGGATLMQAAVTVIAVMMVPMSTLQADPKLVSRRVLHRFAGCLAGALVAALAMLVSQGHVAWTLVCLCIGVAFGRHIENSNRIYAYIGTQFSAVFLIVLVPDSFDTLSVVPGFERLIGILLGMVVIQAIREVLWNVIRVAKRAVAAR